MPSSASLASPGPRKRRAPKVLLVSSSFPPAPGGVAVSTQRIARLLSKGGVETAVAFTITDSGPVLLDGNIETSRDNGVTLHRIHLSTWPALTSGSGPDPLPAVRRAQELFLSLLGLQQRERFDILLGMFLTDVGQAVCTVARLTGAKAVVSIRGNDIGKHTFRSDTFAVIRWVLESADYVTSVSEDLLQLATCLYPIEQKSAVIPNSIDIGGLTLPVHHERPADAPLTFGSLGVFRFKKGLPYLFKAVSNWPSPKKVRLLLVGGFRDTREEQVHQEWMKRAGVESMTRITGALPRQDALVHLGRMDVAVFPSLFSEGTPSAMLEAMAAGKPVIGSNVGGIRDLVTHGDSGLLVPPADSGALREALVSLSDNPSLRAELGQAARRFAESMKPEREAAAWIQVFEHVLGNASRSGV